MALPTPGVTPANWGAQLNAEIEASRGFVPYVHRSGLYVTTPGSTAGSLTMSTGYEYAFPFVVYVSTSYTAIGINVASGITSSLLRLAVRANSAGSPGSVTFDAGSDIDCSTSGNKEVTISQTLAAGFYWLTGRSSGADCVVQGMNNIPVQMSTSQAGAMQNNCTGYNNGGGGGSGAISGAFGTPVGAVAMPRIVLKVA